MLNKYIPTLTHGYVHSCTHHARTRAHSTHVHQGYVLIPIFTKQYIISKSRMYKGFNFFIVA